MIIIIIEFRSEYRIQFRPDNADFRLTEIGHNVGCVSDQRMAAITEIKEQFDRAITQMKRDRRHVNEWGKLLGIKNPKKHAYKSCLSVLGVQVKFGNLVNYVIS